jgi:hypothetical protein
VREAGFDPASADVRRIDGAPRLVALPFRPPPRPAPRRHPRVAPRAGRSLPAATPRPARWVLAGVLRRPGVPWRSSASSAAPNDQVVVVPDVLGASYEVAAATLHASACAPCPSRSRRTTEPAGSVLAATRAPGQTLRPGREVRLSVALPAGQLAPTDVPRLTGLTDVDAAVARSSGPGSRSGRLVRIHVDAPAGVVLAQAPPAGSRVGRGAAVDVVVSLGPRPRGPSSPTSSGCRSRTRRALASVAGLAPRAGRGRAAAVGPRRPRHRPPSRWRRTATSS